MANARVVLDIVPRRAMTVLSVSTNFQAAIGVLSWRMRMTLIATIDRMLAVKASISGCQDLIVLRGLSDFEAALSLDALGPLSIGCSGTEYAFTIVGLLLVEGTV